MLGESPRHIHFSTFFFIKHKYSHPQIPPPPTPPYSPLLMTVLTLSSLLGFNSSRAFKEIGWNQDSAILGSQRVSDHLGCTFIGQAKCPSGRTRTGPGLASI